MSKLKLHCNVKDFDDTRRTFAAIEMALNGISQPGGPAGIAETPWVAYPVRVEDRNGNNILADGTITGYWRRWGSTVEATVEIEPGALTGYQPSPLPPGQGSWYFTLPLGCIATHGLVGSAYAALKYSSGDGFSFGAGSGSGEDYTGSCRYRPEFNGRMMCFISAPAAGAISSFPMQYEWPWSGGPANNYGTCHAEMTLIYPTTPI